MAAEGTILVVAEFDNNPHGIVDRAIRIAGLLNCDLDILLCEPADGALFGGYAMFAEAKVIGRHIQQMQEDFVEELAEQAREAGLTVAATVLERRPVADGVLARAHEINPCIVMKGTQFHSRADRSILIDTDWQLMRTCPYPLWLVKGEEIRENLHIVAAVDPTHAHDKPAALDQVIVDTAKTLARSAGGEVHLFHSYERLAGIGSAANRSLKPGKLPIDEIDQRIKEEHRKALDALARKNDIAADYTHQLPGRTRELLPTFVRGRKVDLVVMGALARWGFKRMIIGSTAERVLDHLPCDVLLVRDNDHQICTVAE